MSRPGDIDHVAVSRDPKANLHKKILFAIQKRPSFTKIVKDRLANVAKVRGIEGELAKALGVEPRAVRAKFHGVEHHKSHISSAFFISPFEEAACLSIDGFGDFVSTMRGVGRDRKLEIIDRIEFPHSAGLFYTAVTQFLGFPPVRRGMEDDGARPLRQTQIRRQAARGDPIRRTADASSSTSTTSGTTARASR